MKDSKDPGTLDIFGFRPVGRPKSPNPASGAQRQAKYRAAEKKRADDRKQALAHLSDATLARYIIHLADDDSLLAKDCWLELGSRLGYR